MHSIKDYCILYLKSLKSTLDLDISLSVRYRVEPVFEDADVLISQSKLPMPIYDLIIRGKHNPASSNDFINSFFNRELS